MTWLPGRTLTPRKAARICPPRWNVGVPWGNYQGNDPNPFPRIRLWRLR